MKKERRPILPVKTAIKIQLALKKEVIKEQIALEIAEDKIDKKKTGGYNKKRRGIKESTKKEKKKEPLV